MLLTHKSDQDKNSPYNIKQKSDEEKEKYQLGDCNWSNTKFSKLKSQELWQMVRKGELKCQGICFHNQTFNHCNPKRRGTKFGHSGAERAKYSQTCIKQLIPQGMVWWRLNPLTPVSDQDRLSPYNAHRQVIRIKKNINYGITNWSDTKFSKLT